MKDIFRYRTAVTETVLSEEAGSIESKERDRLRKALQEGWREVMHIRLGARMLCYSYERNRRRARK